jgi:hypothetical protein
MAATDIKYNETMPSARFGPQSRPALLLNQAASASALPKVVGDLRERTASLDAKIAQPN